MEETGQEVCKELRKKYGDGRVVFYKCDVTSEEELVSISYGSMIRYDLCSAEICFRAGCREVW